MHQLFQFQLESVSILDTMTGTLGMTDVTVAMANFNFYTAVANISKKWTMPLRAWKAALTRFTIQFEGKMPKD